LVVRVLSQKQNPSPRFLAFQEWRYCLRFIERIGSTSRPFAVIIEAFVLSLLAPGIWVLGNNSGVLVLGSAA
jgi:hypothetical protein